jgi:hypothetical protein
MPLTAIAKTGHKAESHRPFPRAIVGSDGWQLALRELVEATATLLGLWSDGEAVHMALHGPEAPEVPGGVITRRWRSSLDVSRSTRARLLISG